MEDKQVKEIAERIFYLFDPWDCDYKTAEEMEQEIKKDPAAVINYLLDVIEG